MDYLPLQYFITFLTISDLIKFSRISKYYKNKIFKDTREFIVTITKPDHAYKLVNIFKNVKLNIISTEFFTDENVNSIVQNIVILKNTVNNLTFTSINKMINLEKLTTILDPQKILYANDLKKLKKFILYTPYIPERKINMYRDAPYFDFYKNKITSLKSNNLMINDLKVISMQHVKKLSLNYWSGITDEGIKNFSCLTELCIGDNNNVTDECLKYLNNLKILHISTNKITNRGLSYLQNLEYLFMWSHIVTITKVGLMALKKLKFITVSLYVGNDDIKDIELECIVLSSGNRITIDGINPKVTYLSVRNENSTICDDDLKKLNLKYLDLCYNNVISDTGLANCKNLCYLSLFANVTITDNGIAHIPNLQYLDLSLYCGRDQLITNHGLRKLINLKYLALQNNSVITDFGLKTLINLEYLNLDDNNVITLRGLKCLKNLRELSIKNCHLKKSTLLFLSKRLPLLKFIDDGTNRKLPDYYYTQRSYYGNPHYKLYCANNFYCW